MRRIFASIGLLLFASPLLAEPIAFFSFDDAQAPLQDASGNGVPATINPGTAPSWVENEGYLGTGCYRFDGIDDFIRVELDLNPWFHARPQCTFGAFVKLENFQPNRGYTVISTDDGGYDRTIAADTRAGSGTRWAAYRPGHGVSQATPVVDESWTFIAAVYDRFAGHVTLYVNGVAYVDSSNAPNSGASQPFLHIGRNPGHSAVFSGLIDNAFFFEGLLTAEQIQAIHTSPDPVQTILATVPDNSERDRFLRDGFMPDPRIEDIILHNGLTALQNNVAPPAWSYTTMDPGPAFSEADFNDSQWSSGIGGFGRLGFRFERYQTQTDWMFPEGQPVSHLWLRHEFEIEEEADLLSIDGTPISFWGNWARNVDVYINGVPAFDWQSEVPEGEQILIRASDEYRYLPIRPEALAALQTGSNTISAHVEGFNQYRYFDLAIVKNPMDGMPDEGWFANPDLMGLLTATREIVSATQIPAASVAVVRNGRLVANFAVGYAEKFRYAGDPEAVPARRDDYYRLASLGKPPAAVALRTLISEGVIDPATGTTLEMTTPVWPLYESRGMTPFPGATAAPEYALITLEHLIYHESGLPNQRWVGHIAADAQKPESELEPWDILRDIYSLPPRFVPPGSNCEYSNAGYFLQRDLADRVSGNLLDYLNNEISGWNGLGYPPFAIAYESLDQRQANEVWFRTLEWPFSREAYLSAVHSLSATAAGYAIFADQYAMPFGNPDPSLCAIDRADCHEYCQKGGLMPGTSTIVKQRFNGNNRTTFVVMTNQDNLVGDNWFPGFYTRFIDFIDSSTPDQWESPAGPEDIDADWDFDADDTTKFVASLLGNPQEWYHAVRSDLNGDHRVDGADIAGFVDAVLN